ncbi:MAG: GAF domain-containing protein, partial [Chloroflexota bacterium]
MVKKTPPVRKAVKQGKPKQAKAKAQIAKTKAPRLNVEGKRQAKIMKALYEIADAASAARNMQSFYKKLRKIVGKLMYAENFFIALYDEQTDLITWPYHADVQDTNEKFWSPQSLATFKGATGWILRNGKTLADPDGSAQAAERRGEIKRVGTKSEGIGIPLKSEGKTIGVLAVQSYERGIKYNLQDIEILNFVAQHIATALTRARALEAERQRTEELAILNSVGEAMAKSLDVRTVTRIVGDKVRDIFGADQVGILLLERQTNLLRLLYGYDKANDRYLDDGQIKPIPLGQGLTSKVIESRQPLLFGTQEEKKGYGHYMPPELEGQINVCESWLGVPIMVADTVLGAALVEDYRPHAYNESHL